MTTLLILQTPVSFCSSSLWFGVSAYLLLPFGFCCWLVNIVFVCLLSISFLLSLLILLLILIVIVVVVIIVVVLVVVVVVVAVIVVIAVCFLVAELRVYWTTIVLDNSVAL